MGRARLTRIDAVQEMVTAIDAFRIEVLVALEGLDMDAQRGQQWIHGDRTEHWRGEVRRGYDRVTQARLQLQQARITRRVGDHEPACVDEKKALSQAERRLRTAQEKVEAVRQASRAIDEAIHDYRAAKGPLSSWLDAEAYKALAALRRMMDNLEAYIAAQTPGGERAPAPARVAEAGQGQASRGEEKQSRDDHESNRVEGDANQHTETATLNIEYSPPSAGDAATVSDAQSPASTASNPPGLQGDAP